MKTFFIRLMDFFARPRVLAAYVALASAAVLGAAYVSQYGFGLDPCVLCYYQRIPYFINILLGLLAFWLAARHPRAARGVLLLCALVFFADGLIAGFHVGVENGWWEGLKSCGNAALPARATPEELRAFLHSRDIVRCDVPAFTLFGISMAGYNFLLALGLMMDALILLWWGRRARA